eukprot:31244_1
METVRWEGNSGDIVTREPFAPSHAEFRKVRAAREELIEQLAECDDEIMEYFLQDKEPTEPEIRSAIRRATLDCRAVPVLCGSSLKHRGVQPVLDAVVDFLPSPLDRPEITAPTVRLEGGGSKRRSGRRRRKGVRVEPATGGASDTSADMSAVRPDPAAP